MSPADGIESGTKTGLRGFLMHPRTSNRPVFASHRDEDPGENLETLHAENPLCQLTH
jgi:hypothetical protein